MTIFKPCPLTGWPRWGRGPMSFVAASPVRTCPTLEKARDLPANDPACGVNTPGSLARYDQHSLSWKTSQLCLDGGLETFSETWPRSGTMLSGTAFRLPPLALPTGETASGYWPTPNRVDAEGGVRTGKGQTQLCHAVQAAARLWPTPTREDGESKGMSSARMEARGPDNLASAVKLWPTPAARDYRAPNKPDGVSRLSRPPTSGEQLPNAVGGVLNPEWVELMMGYPLGYTDIRSSLSHGKATRPARSGAATPTADKD